MVHRTHWISAVERLWAEKSVVWLKGVRRAGKTFLCQSLPNVEYFDCELPSTRQELSDPERFLRNVRDRRLVLDEIHRLPEPSELLKIAADYYPKTHIVATGSSVLGRFAPLSRHPYRSQARPVADADASPRRT